jgi:hypothetical protein
MEIAGHVSRQMLAGYSDIRMDAKRKVLEPIVKKPAPAPPAPGVAGVVAFFSAFPRLESVRT